MFASSQEVICILFGFCLCSFPLTWREGSVVPPPPPLVMVCLYGNRNLPDSFSCVVCLCFLVFVRLFVYVCLFWGWLLVCPFWEEEKVVWIESLFFFWGGGMVEGGGLIQERKKQKKVVVFLILLWVGFCLYILFSVSTFFFCIYILFISILYLFFFQVLFVFIYCHPSISLFIYLLTKWFIYSSIHLSPIFVCLSFIYLLSIFIIIFYLPFHLPFIYLSSIFFLPFIYLHLLLSIYLSIFYLSIYLSNLSVIYLIYFSSIY